MSRRRPLCAVGLGVLLLASACSSGAKKTGPTNTTIPTGTPTGVGASTRTTVNRSTSTTRPTPPPSITPATGISSITLPPVAVGKPAELASKLVVTVTGIKAQTLGAQGPGEVTGPGIIVTVEIHNETDASVDLNGLVMNAHYGQGVPATPIFVPGQRLEGYLAPGQRKSGRYEFHIARGQADTVVIDIEQSNSPNVVIVNAAR